MTNFITRCATSLRARWRWNHGRCPACNRRLFSVFDYHMKDHPACFCVGETHCDLKFWCKYENQLASTGVLIPVVAKQSMEGIGQQQRYSPTVLAANDQRSSGRVTLSQTDKADVVRWEGEGGSLPAQPLKAATA